MKSVSPIDTPDYLFLELLDRYVRRVADACDLPAVTTGKELLNKVDLSALTSSEQKDFENWLFGSFYTRLGVENALRRGLSVKAFLTKKTTNQVGYSMHINS